MVEDQTELICRFTPDEILTFVNKAYCDYFGKKRDDLVGKRFMPLIPLEDRKRVEHNLNTLSKNQSILVHEHRVAKNDNTMGWIRWTNRAFFNPDGKLTEIQAVGRDITVQKAAEVTMKELLVEKEVLLKEVYHRVKNNFQVVTSLLNLQVRNIKDKNTQQMLMESRDRVRTMSMVHERLYQSKDLSKLHLAEYIQTLTRNLIRSYSTSVKHVSLITNIEDITLGIDQAIPCGLVLNELISNSLKYAFPKKWKGKAELHITFQKKSKDKSEIELTVRDNGIGIPETVDIEKTNTLGLHLVDILVKDQLQGTVKLQKKDGTQFKILFKKS